MEIDALLIDRINNLAKPTLVGVSGFGGSGKSSFSKKMGEYSAAPVIGIDSFQKKGAFNTEYSLWEIMDFDRLEREVLIPFADKQDIIRYGHFDAKTESISETIEIQNAGILIIEGVGLFRPELMKYFTFKIWMDCPIEEAIARGKKRDREEYGNPQDELWEGICRENDMQYYETYKPKEAADVIIANSYSGKNGATGRDF